MFSVASADSEPAELVTLNWSGGVTPIYPDEHLDAINLALFKTQEGGTLADDAEWFMDRVRDRITHIFDDSTGPSVRVEQATDVSRIGETVVYLTQVHSLRGGSEVGEAEYDPCNRQHDNTAIIFGDELRDRAGMATLDEWVNLFANVAAHEIAHTLGYGHVDRSTQTQAERTLFVELMLSGHTMHELRSEQRLTSDPADCPDEPTFIAQLFGAN